MSGNAREPGRSTVDRLLTLLDVFDGGDLSLVEVADRSRLPLSTAHRMLAALESWGGVERGTSGRYRVGVRLWALGARASAPSAMREAALPVMQDLYEATHENVQLAIREGHSALVVERLTGMRSVVTRTEVGGRLPLHATGVGKVLLAAEPRLLPELYAGGLRRYTRHTVVLPQRLAAALTRIRETGVAYAAEEMTLGAGSVATPVVGAGGTVRAALSIVAHSHIELSRFAGVLHRASRELSRRLDDVGEILTGSVPAVRSGR